MVRYFAVLASTCLTAGMAVLFHQLWLSDINDFFKGFINAYFLISLAAVIIIVLGLILYLRLEFDRLEKAFGESFLEARNASRNYIYLLSALFMIAVVFVIIKPMIEADPSVQLAFIGAGIVIVMLNVLALLDLMIAVLRIVFYKNEKTSKFARS